MLCDIPFYSDLTRVNIQAFLSSKLAIVDNFEKLETLLSIDQTYEFIIAFATIKNIDVTKKIYELKVSTYVPSIKII